MGTNMTRRHLLTILIAGLAIAVCFAFSAAPVSAASKKTVSLIKDKNITYYKTGLVKRIIDEDAVSEFKYDKAGRLTQVLYSPYEDGIQGDVDYGFELKYSKGKLKKIYYLSGDSRDLVPSKIGKKNQILRMRTQFSEDTEQLFTWKYDSKSRIKKCTLKMYTNGEESLTQIYTAKRNSKGYIKKLYYSDSDDEKYTIPFTTKTKKGKVTKITYKTAEGHKETHKYKYAKKKINKKYVKAVKAQQLDLLYYQIAEAYGTINPFL